jgi:hypothetical protein
VHNIIEQLHDGLFQKEKKMQLTNVDNLQLLVKKVIIHNPSALHKRQIPESKENYAHGTLCPTEHNQRAVMLCVSHWDSNSIHN